MSISAGLEIGTHLEDQGGYLGGYISHTEDGVPTHALIVSDKTAGDEGGLDHFTSGISGALSPFDGRQNHLDILASGGTTAVNWIESNLNGTSHAGFNDWYMASRAETDILFWHLKPSTENNSTLDQYPNPYAIPPRGEDRTAAVPAQTDVEIFQGSGGAQSIWTALLWTSTFTPAPGVFYQVFRSSDAGRQILRTTTGLVGDVRAIRRVPVEPPPTEEEVFRASFEDASGRDPLPTALLNRTPARQLAEHNVLVYKYPPYIAIKRVPIRLEDYPLTMPGMMIWHQDDRDPLFNMGRWAQIQGRRFGDNPIEVELTLRISDHPQSFEAPQ